MKLPHLLSFPGIGADDMGYLSVVDQPGAPFEVKRVFWTYNTPETIVRGRHAHHRTEHVLLAVTGRIVVLTEMPNQELQTFVLDRPDVGVYIPPCCWHTMQYSAGAVQLTLASTPYAEADYIRTYAEFRRVCSSQSS
ncbi:dTDP-4-dehydrorhamnose 3,5-epimerase-like enzyme [Hymenobacter luteus]|uniref:dTDP-4-dehydrorhamnose 3,5-epimerase-like enzyme n=2 Tax=Hymenobacter TaxID=89966 RepID=A0A7W9T1Y2_9BACT|nr:MULTISPECIES: FdtA/QdtA family cupin domain-containing protein [Hymenobacter]MBB4600600.1 dTDP-4-dehydrorhamnose 3,5-epimerase-like enzyme [Hymenobacter latericoloratus]MBB6059193.1 dTDP-4-dehydrorhamnose 3,5-epimerase-like enzyme [Hymenobacter luteus]